MSKLLTFLFTAILLAGVCGFVYLAIVDIPVKQTQTTSETTLYDLKNGATTDE